MTVKYMAIRIQGDRPPGPPGWRIDADKQLAGLRAPDPFVVAPHHFKGIIASSEARIGGSRLVPDLVPILLQSCQPVFVLIVPWVHEAQGSKFYREKILPVIQMDLLAVFNGL